MICASDHVLVGDGEHLVMGDGLDVGQVDVLVHLLLHLLIIYILCDWQTVNILLSYSNMSKPKYRIPKNLCQSCYQVSGRYILDCYCIICDQCYASCHNKGSICSLCGQPTKGNKIDAKQESSIKKIGHLFESLDVGMQRILQVYKFQNQIANRYCQYLEKQLGAYQAAVSDILMVNPSLYGFFSARVKLKKSAQTQQYQSRSISVRPDPTIKPDHKNNRDFASEIMESRRSTLDLNRAPGRPHNPAENMSGIRPIGKNGNNVNHSGNVIYKVPNINYNTAIRSSKRITKGYDKVGPGYDDQEYYPHPNYPQNNSRRY